MRKRSEIFRDLIRPISQQGEIKITLLLFSMSVFCFALSVFRYVITDTRTFLFLNWNLFLAFIPWAASAALSQKIIQPNKFQVFALLMVWIVFFPNSPYILTDLFHLGSHSSAPIWFDLVLILAFAWTGLSYGLVSLQNIERMLRQYLRPLFAHLSIAVLLFIGSFGVYLGRFERWNSWNLLNHPFSLGADISDRFLNPAAHPRTWGVTILLGILLNMIYWTFQILNEKSSQHPTV